MGDCKKLKTCSDGWIQCEARMSCYEDSAVTLPDEVEQALEALEKAYKDPVVKQAMLDSFMHLGVSQALAACQHLRNKGE